MSIKSKLGARWRASITTPVLLRGILLFGIGARIVRYVYNLSLWGDEAALAMGLIGSGWSDLLLPLKYHQTAPLGFLALEKLAILLLGEGEYALRLVPLLAGIASVGLFIRLARRIFPDGQLVLASLLFAASEPLIFYANEVKQYSMEVLVGVIILDALLAALQSDGAPGRLAWLAAAGLLCLPFSNTAPFLLGGGGLAAMWVFRRQNRAKALVTTAVSAAGWCAAYGVLYAVQLRHVRSSGYFKVFWDQYFLYLPGSWDDLGSLIKRFLLYFNDPLHFQAAELAALVFVLGLVQLYRRNRQAMLVLAMPMALLILAAFLQLYPFPPRNRVFGLSEIFYPLFGRLILFTVPPALLIISAGFGFLASLERKASRLLIAATALFMLALPLVQTVRNLFVPPRLHEVRPIVDEVYRRRRPGDVFLYQTWSKPVFEYYAYRKGWNPELLQASGRNAKELAALAENIRSMPSGMRFWILSAHIYNWGSEEEETKIVATVGTLAAKIDAVKDYKASATLWVRRS